MSRIWRTDMEAHNRVIFNGHAPKPRDPGAEFRRDANIAEPPAAAPFQAVA